MKYKETVQTRLESADQKIDILSNGIGSRTLTTDEILRILGQMKSTIASVIELIDLE